MSGLFKPQTPHSPKGDQPEAIAFLSKNILEGVKEQVLLGVTGSGKTFTMARVIAECDRPALVLAPNKTLAAQLFHEFHEIFPENAVEYFVSYYDYYQPEAYLPHSDTYIEKDSSINDDIDKLRHAATHALLTRRDVIIVASVSCIYGLGSPEYYARMVIPVQNGDKIPMESIIKRLVEVQYKRNDYDFHRGTFRVRGDTLEIIPAYQREEALRLEFFGDEIESISAIDYLTGQVKAALAKTVIFPASHYVSDQSNLERARKDIMDELAARLIKTKAENKLIEARRLEQRTMYDLEMIEELGYCNGIENYSRHLDNRQAGQPPACLLDYFPDDFLLFVDESHITVPQLNGMYNGDRSRKTTLVDFGFRLPSALDNRPLRFEEVRERLNQVIYVSATPGPYELKQAGPHVAEQIIRPTGLLDPLVELRPVAGQVDNLLAEGKRRRKKNQRMLVTALTKRMAEDLTEYFNNMGLPARYLHCDIDTLERMAIIKALRAGEFTALIGINLLREGLDIPEVSLVAILDADKEGFLRSYRALIQTFGRAARNAEGKALLYADHITESMAAAMAETARRREAQDEFNRRHGITPASIIKTLDNNMLSAMHNAAKERSQWEAARQSGEITSKDPKELARDIKTLERRMREAARDLEFEQAATLRDRIKLMREQLLAI